MSNEFEWEKPENTLDFALIQKDLVNLITATENKCEREWPSHLGGDKYHAGPFWFGLKIVRWAFKASCYLLADKPEDPRRRLEYAIVIPPINRMILDMVFNYVFIFDDFKDRLCWYLHSGYEQRQEKLARFQSTYGNDPAWAPFFAGVRQMLDPFKNNRDVVCGGNVPKSKGRFPHPGRIISPDVHFNDSKARDFLKYLNDWFYRDLSSSAHAHWTGVTENVVQILRMEEMDAANKKLAEKLKSDRMMEQIALILCLLAEIIVAAGFDNRAKAAYLWSLLASYSPVANELYIRRYQNLLV